MAPVWYAELPARRSRQLAADLVVVGALLVCLALALAVHDVVSELAAPGRRLESAGAGLADRMSQAGSAADGVPLVGEELGTPFDRASESAATIEGAGVEAQQAVATLADVLAWLSGGFPALVVLLLWLPRRLRFARRAANASRLRDTEGGLDLLALRALARQPVREVSRFRSDAVQGWRRGDAEVVRELAAAELRQMGLRLTPRRAGRL